MALPRHGDTRWWCHEAGSPGSKDRQDDDAGGHGVERDAHRFGSSGRERPVDGSDRLVGVDTSALRLVAINQTRGAWDLNQS